MTYCGCVVMFSFPWTSPISVFPVPRRISDSQAIVNVCCKSEWKKKWSLWSQNKINICKMFHEILSDQYQPFLDFKLVFRKWISFRKLFFFLCRENCPCLRNFCRMPIALCFAECMTRICNLVNVFRLKCWWGKNLLKGNACFVNCMFWIYVPWSHC